MFKSKFNICNTVIFVMGMLVGLSSVYFEKLLNINFIVLVLVSSLSFLLTQKKSTIKSQ